MDGFRFDTRPRQGIQSAIRSELRDLITSGELEPGTALSEVTLARQFDVSRTPVREALKQLQTEGLVVIKPQVGTFVASRSVHQVEEMSHVREALEALAAELMATAASEKHITALTVNMSQSDTAVAQSDTSTYARLVAEFHDIIASGSRNSVLQRHCELITAQPRYPSLVTTSLKQPTRASASLAEHRAIFEAIRDGDPAGAARAMRAHVRSSHAHTMLGLKQMET